MRVASLLTAAIGLGVAGGAVYYTETQLSVLPQETAVQAEVVNVVVAKQDVPFGHEIERHMLTTIEWPAKSVPQGAITDLATVLPTEGIEPRRAKRALSQGELLLPAKLSDWGEKVTIVQTLGENNRAVSITVNAQTGVSGFVTPGDEVDIVLTRGGKEDLRATTILQKIRVIGVDQRSDEENEQAIVARTVTVEVTPEQGQKLALAQRAGTLSLSLRSLEAGFDEQLDAVRLSDLLADDTPQAEEAPRSVVRVRRAATEVTEQAVN